MNPVPTPIVHLHNHRIYRGEVILCEGVCLQLNAGQVCHLMGNNGTGKTTLLMQLSGLLPLSELLPLSGYPESAERITTVPARSPVYMSHQLGIHTDLTVEQNLRFLGQLYGIILTDSELKQALTWVDLLGYEDVPCYQLSAGQQRKVTLARLQYMTPMHSPLWLLDEPFTTLDASMVARLQDRIKTFADAGGAVLMTSHQLATMQTVANCQLNLSEFIFCHQL